MKTCLILGTVIFWYCQSAISAYSCMDDHPVPSIPNLNSRWKFSDLIGLASASDMAVNQSGNLVVSGVGLFGDKRNFGWIVRISGDGGRFWKTVDEVQRSRSFPFAVATNENTILVSGSYEENGRTHWLTRISLDGGISWRDSDNFSSSQFVFTSPAPRSVGIDPVTGDFFSAGYIGSQFLEGTWVVRRSTDHGRTWGIVDDKLSNAVPYGGFTFDRLGSIFVSGYVQDSNGVRQWIVRKGIRRGTSWRTLETFRFGQGLEATSRGLTTDIFNDLYASGYARDKDNRTYWVVRKSIDSGKTWRIIDKFKFNNQSQAYGIGSNSSGDLVATGCGEDLQGHAHWIVRSLTKGAGRWTTIDDFLPAATAHAFAYRPVFDNSGRLFIAGESYDPSGIYNWIVRFISWPNF